MPDGTLVFGIVLCYLGSAAEGERAIKALREAGNPMTDMLAERPYPQMQSLFDKDIPPGKRYYNKSHNLRRMSDGAIDAVLRFTATMLPYPSMIGFQQLHGAAARVPTGATAFPHRYDHHVVWISPVEEDAALDENPARPLDLEDLLSTIRGQRPRARSVDKGLREKRGGQTKTPRFPTSIILLFERQALAVACVDAMAYLYGSQRMLVPQSR